MKLMSAEWREEELQVVDCFDSGACFRSTCIFLHVNNKRGRISGYTCATEMACYNHTFRVIPVPLTCCNAGHDHV